MRPYIEESFRIAKNAVHVEPVAEERESPSDGSRETREITREKRKGERKHASETVTRARIQEIYETGNDCCEVKGDHTRNRPRVSIASVLMRIEAPSED